MPRVTMTTDEMAALYRAGITHAEIAERAGCTRPAVSSRLRKAGVTGTGPRPSSRGPEILRLRAKGMPPREIAAALRTSVQEVYRVIRVHGVVASPAAGSVEV